MYNLTFLKKENDLNKIIKNYRRDKTSLSILFISLWDKYCTELVDRLKEEEGDSSQKVPLYVVDSYNMPHSFVIFKTTVVPHLVTLGRNFVKSQDYLPLVYEELGVG